MPRVYTVRANKDYPDQNIEKGQTYFKWKTRPGGRGTGIVHRSPTYPKPWQLTSSPFLQELYLIQHALDELEPGEPKSGELDSQITELADRIRDLGQEAQDSLDNMPEHLQDSSSSGELLRERAEACEQAADDLEAIAGELNSDSDQETLDSACEQAKEVEVSC